LSVALYYLDDDWEVASVDVRTGTLELGTDANEGSVATSQCQIDDPAGTFEVRGLRPAWAIETQAAGDDYDGILWTGFIGVREYTRGEHVMGALGRTVTIELHDLNEQLDRILMEGADAKRAEESSNTRLAWLLGTSETSFIEDESFVSTATSDTMSEADYRGQKIRDILDDLGQQTGINWYLWNVTDTGDNPSKFGLWYGRDDPTTITTFVVAEDQQRPRRHELHDGVRAVPRHDAPARPVPGVLRCPRQRGRDKRLRRPPADRRGLRASGRNVHRGERQEQDRPQAAGEPLPRLDRQ
jgi:hypothetical protein